MLNDKELYNKIIENTKIILSNTENFYLKQDIEFFLDTYIEYGNETDLVDLLEVMTIIANDNYDITGFELHEVPHPSIYVFYNKTKHQMFDVCIDDFNNSGCNTYIAYLDEQNNECHASSIEYAIRNFNKEFLQ